MLQWDNWEGAAAGQPSPETPVWVVLRGGTAVREDKESVAKDLTPTQAIALDLGGTRFRVAVGTSEGEIEWRLARPTAPGRGRQAVLDDMFNVVDEALAAVPDKKTVKGIGIGAPGPLNPWTGVIHNPPNLPGWDMVPLKQLFEERFALPVQVGNDANLAAVGEHQFGAGRGLTDVVYVTVSTGIGGGVIASNQLLLGHCGFAGEVGHMTIAMDGPLCSCGNVGCLEAIASGTAIASQARALVLSGAVTALNRIPLAEITAERVTELAYQGDSVAERVLRNAGVALGVGMVNLSHLFNPQRVIVGGGVSNAGPLLWEPMREVLRTRAISACQRDMEIVPAALGDDAGLLGAVATVTLG